jgi:hypothetical protein
MMLEDSVIWLICFECTRSAERTELAMPSLDHEEPVLCIEERCMTVIVIVEGHLCFVRTLLDVRLDSRHSCTETTFVIQGKTP